MSQNYSYFAHKECEYFPCHKGADPENFNCLFCLFPHRRENYQKVIARYKDILGVLKRLEAENRTESGENA